MAVASQEIKSVPISSQTSEAVAHSAFNISRQAGVVAAGAVAVTSQVGPYGQPAKAVAVGATVIGLGADAVEQIARPNTGQVIVNSTSLIVQTLTERLPYGGVVTPITNEILEAWKASGSSMSVQEWVNSRLRNK